MNLVEYRNKIEQDVMNVVSEYPYQVPLKIVADFFGIGIDKMHGICESPSGIGFAYKPLGKQNRGYVVPTTQFVYAVCPWMKDI